MIRRLIDAVRARGEIAELRDRAVRDAAMIERLRHEAASALARLDQSDATMRNVATLLGAHGHAGATSGCLGCIIVASLTETRQAIR